ncbi:MAG: leucine-rich repeat domain-containing protein [Paludibacteraceae bacterium]|nr:leucine-rich repeat domain-containing protein [Paludibacteraceae bacterium]
MKTRHIVCLLAGTFLLVQSVHATVYNGVCGEHLTWSYDTETAHMTVEGYGELKNVVDSLWWNKQVLQASSWATDYKTYYPYNSCKTISLPEGLTGFSGATFRDWWNLTACEIPEGVTKIHAYMFANCRALKEIKLPNSVDTVGQYVFSNCTTMVKCDLGKGVKYIGQMAFENCYKLNSVRWSDCLEVIDGSIFDGEPNRAEYDQNAVATIPIQDTLFFPATFRSGKQISWCYHKNPVIVWNAKNPPSSSSVFRNLYDYFSNSFIFGPDVEFVPANLCQYVRPKKIELPEGCKYIGSGAFSGNNSLDTVILPSTLTAIHQEAFKGCSKLKLINLPDGLTAISSSTFNGCSGLERVHLSDGITTIGDNAFAGCSALDSIVLPAELTMVGGSAFSGINNQDTLVIPDKVVSVGTNAFENWSSLRELTIGKNVVLIGDNAFKGDSAVTHITVWASTPPIVSEGTLADIPDSALLSVLPDSRKLYGEHPYWGRFRMNETPDSAMVQRTVTVDAAETTADFTWPTDSTANTYQIDIYKNGTIFCKLTLGNRGQLLGIAFVPERKQQSAAGELPYTLSFKVTGLDEASRYSYVLSVLDAADKPIHVYVGDFATTGYEGELQYPEGNEILPTPPIIPGDPDATIYTDTGEYPSARFGGPDVRACVFREGRLLLITPDGIYSITGQRIE